MTQRTTNWIQTFTGRAYYPCEPRAEDICIEDIAAALSKQCRYSGHTNRFYSVAEHCLWVSFMVAPENQFQALMHDAAEAYVVDVPRPLKPYIPDHQRIEKLNWNAICAKFGMPVNLPSQVHDADMAICWAEKRELLPHNAQMWNLPIPEYEGLDWCENAGVRIRGLSPSDAEWQFHKRFNYLYRRWQDRNLPTAA